ncbi:MAG: hypothetical protein AB7V58_11060 [Solirubrobacterales bacterium]
MIGRKTVLGLVVLCALAVSAFAAASASASEAGGAWKCKAVKGTGHWNDDHCTNTNAGNTGNWDTTWVPGSFNIVGSNAKTTEATTGKATSKLLGSLSGVVTELQCTEVSGAGELTNSEVGETKSVTGTGVITYESCSVTKPSGKGCVVKGGTVVTKTLKGTTVGVAAERLKFEPNSGTTFAEIEIEKCTIGALNNTFPVTGSLVAETTGATTTSTHAGITAQGTLKFGGVKAGLEGALTIEDTEENGLVLMP